MRRLTYILVALTLPLLATAQVTVSGTHYELPKPVNTDHVILFADLTQPDAYLAYTGADAFEWRDLNGATIQSGTGAETLYPENDKGYVLYTADTTICFYVLDYSQYRPTLNSLTPTPGCDQTELALDAVLPTMRYFDRYQMLHDIVRQAEIEYTTLAWDEANNAWADSTAVETVRILPTMVVGAPYRDTQFVLRTDQFAAELGLERDSILTDEMAAIAVTSHPTSITTKRGEQRENELERPIEETQLSGSAPLEIHFLANANKPVAQFYRWEIYKGTNLIASRTDEEQRYMFLEDGSYQVKVWVANEFCTTDSTVFDISVSTSQLVVPNAFTPNGDGLNDEFRVMYRSLMEFHCWIYNRWGKLVYQWDDPAKGWDGTINGRPAAAGAYYYIIRARGTDADPSVKYHKTTKRRPADVGVYQLSGDINLIR